jgi:lipopolysaccharide/colanic/teichoic acid biosynthesis glycosyltransferase
VAIDTEIPQPTAPSSPPSGVVAGEVQVTRPVLLRREPLLKRPLDVMLSGAMLAVSSPVWAVVALAIRLEDGGPVFYRQERWGRGGHKFTVLKFRTMVPDSDRRFGVRQATESDDRITRVGRLLRACGMDELPQLVNIFRGEMSFVGPRALATTERDKDGNPLAYDGMSRFVERLSVRPGLTGLATIYLPKDVSARRKFRVDELYIRKQSFWLDVRLIVLSFWISFRGNWETRGRKV